MHDIYILSDLHIGRGKNPNTRRYYALENFFYDDDFYHFCDYICRDAKERKQQVKIIFNGDTFDFLRIDPDPNDKTTYPSHTPEQAAKTIAQILIGHPGFVRGVAQLLDAGHHVIFLPGNHDIEIQWQPVQEEIRHAIMQQTQHDISTLLHFKPWFYYEPGRIWVEHGCQYDPENSFRYFLRTNLADKPESMHEIESDFPLGNFFQRYLYNFFGHITFIVPSTRANLRYLKWLLFHEPQLLLRVAFRHLPFIFHVLKRLTQAKKSNREMLLKVHKESLDHLAHSSNLHNKLIMIDDLKEVRADVVQAVRSLGWQLGRLLGGGIFTIVLIVSLWLFCFDSIAHLHLSFGPKAMLLLFFELMTIIGALASVIYLMLGSSSDISPRPLRRAAQKIANIIHVPIVCFGHSHDEEIWPIDTTHLDRAWYCNTGTWIAVFTHDVLLPRERVQYTFLRIKDNDPELLHWSPGRSEPLPVILLEETT